MAQSFPLSDLKVFLLQNMNYKTKLSDDFNLTKKHVCAKVYLKTAIFCHGLYKSIFLKQSQMCKTCVKKTF